MMDVSVAEMFGTIFGQQATPEQRDSYYAGRSAKELGQTASVPIMHMPSSRAGFWVAGFEGRPMPVGSAK